jgi:hypothetical protein
MMGSDSSLSGVEALGCTYWRDTFVVGILFLRPGIELWDIGPSYLSILSMKNLVTRN